MDIIINNKEKSKTRTENIAHARNSLLDVIIEKYSDWKYFIMMDSNEYSCIGNMNLNTLNEVLTREDEWDSISFDREAGYYDTWALSFDPFVYSFNHISNWKEYCERMMIEFSTLLNKYKNELPNEFIEVYSSFNGFAIYKSEKFLNCRYSSNIDLNLFSDKKIEFENYKKIDELTDDCEHRHFHLEAIKKNNARIKISTKYLFLKLETPIHGLRGPA
jgi:hypothetical protein